MYRSGSSTRVSDEFFSNPTSTATPDTDPHLPIYNPESHLAKKEKIRLRSAETAVHIIPILLILCAVILWFFSTPVFCRMIITNISWRFQLYSSPAVTNGGKEEMDDVIQNFN